MNRIMMGVAACIILLAACTKLAWPLQSAPASPVVFLAATKTARPSFTVTIPAPAKTVSPSLPVQTVDQLIAVLYVSDPDLPQYDPLSASYAAFPDTLQQLTAMGPKAIDAASHIAVAISFPRQDSFLAAQALISFGPDIAATTLPILKDNLHRPRSETRLNSTLVISTIGERASCAVGDIGPLLWDADASVRFAAAYALEKITKKGFLPSHAWEIPNPLSSSPIPGDTPAGKLTGDARRWWTVKGSKINWHPSYGICDP